MDSLKITDIRPICTAPEGINLVVVKVETNDPSIYGVGCATFTQRYEAVAHAVDRYLKPFLLGKDPARIQDIWQTAHVSGYWRNGPIWNNALSGIDMALWDIKGKMAGMPLYDLFGGKCRDAVPAYIHADAQTIEGAIDLVQQRVDAGWNRIRVQIGGYGGNVPVENKPKDALPGAYYDPKVYMRTAIEGFAALRREFGDDIELCHDVHERLTPSEAIRFAQQMDQFDLLFLEDVLAPEQIAWFDQVRAHTTCPLAMGELINNPHEWMQLVQNRSVDYLRLHISQAGGITPVRKIIAFADVNGVRTAWHGPGDMSGIGHAVNTHLSISSPNFGIQEWSCSIKENTYRVFPGMPVVENGYVYLNDQPGIGVDIDENLAAEFPPIDKDLSWLLCRLPDGSAARP